MSSELFPHNAAFVCLPRLGSDSHVSLEVRGAGDTQLTMIILLKRQEGDLVITEALGVESGWCPGGLTHGLVLRLHHCRP